MSIKWTALVLPEMRVLIGDNTNDKNVIAIVIIVILYCSYTGNSCAFDEDLPDIFANKKL